MSTNNEENNGLITKLWGGSGWEFLHSITFGYPVQPTEENKRDYFNFFMNTGYVLPCVHCRDSYLEFVKTDDTILDEAALESRDSLTRWLYRLHERVNKKLGVDYYVTFDEIADKYNCFRAKCIKTGTGCVTPLNRKAASYKLIYDKGVPVIPLHLAKLFVPLAKKMGLSDEYFYFIDLADKVDGNITILKKSKSWKYRSELCIHWVKNMRLNAIESVDPKTGLPTLQELMLIVFMSSNLSQDELIDISNYI